MQSFIFIYHPNKVNRGKGSKRKKAKGTVDVTNDTRSVIGQKMDSTSHLHRPLAHQKS